MIPARKSPLLSRWFADYTRRYLRRSFHAVYLLGDLPDLRACDRVPLIVCLNHTSWWDVLLGTTLANDVFGWEWYGVMDARQLERYRMFTRMGMIGVDRTSLAGAREFLEYATRLLRGQRRALWLTPQGEMLSNRARPVRFQPGVGHLVAQLGDCYVTTVALHYEFWQEKRPEAFAALGPVQRVHVDANFRHRDFVCQQERALEAQLDALLALAQQRDPAAFRLLLKGRSGISPTYDLLRSLGARLRGQPFHADHGEVVTPPWRSRR
ncbi:MAG: lysophospholipid acyltransferase family protein [Chloroherpetonaceae bacterium]|nr:lysophospholipid acyltransferase family protein [Chthonomonadaceae bacterium]MDW8206208.1 lysophospholipid acyltransferase family protein [Chloroherpetonaceae bacterium]